MFSESIFWTLHRQLQLPDNDHWLTVDEQERLANMRFPKRRQEWLLGRWTAKKLLLATLQGFSSISMEQLSIENETSGAPFALCKGARLEGMLSISHRDDLAVAAWCPKANIHIGIDLELIEPKSPAFIDDFFSLDEAARVFTLAAEQQPLAACLTWSAKESLLKALQTGLSIDTRQVQVDCGNLTLSEKWQSLTVERCASITSQQKLFWLCQPPYVITLAVLGETTASSPLFVSV